MQLTRLTPAMLQKLYRELESEDYELSISTVHHVHVVLKECLKSAVNLGQIAFNPAERAKASRMAQTEMLTLDPE